jgi:hypothetical protein
VVVVIFDVTEMEAAAAAEVSFSGERFVVAVYDPDTGGKLCGVVKVVVVELDAKEGEALPSVEVSSMPGERLVAVDDTGGGSGGVAQAEFDATEREAAASAEVPSMPGERVVAYRERHSYLQIIEE